ncbi:MAG TPA: YdcF family protein, partial [Candidatus Didemnitutus sp.]|nr:YdcF family protein [Candidatus Didemnitutus sp.]
DPLPPQPVDAVIGFGVFDLSLPRYCADLYLRGHCRCIVFTGGIGAGTGNLGGPEADAWRVEVRRSHPELHDDVYILENRSTNTAENIGYTAEVLSRQTPTRAFGSGIKSALLVASPSRLRRVRLTMLKLQPAVRAFRSLPQVDFDRERELYEGHGVDFIAHLVGELDRIETYPARGWIVAEPLPSEIAAAGKVLREAGGQSRI